jgi:hypothetical protein
MKKIPSLFCRNHDTSGLVRNEVTPGCEWVIAGEGVATRKYDGACCMFRGGRFFKRRSLSPTDLIPPGFEPATDLDPMTHRIQGWVPVSEDAREDCYFREARRALKETPADGTYELCGPMVQGNPEKFKTHVLVRHGIDILDDCPREYHALREYLSGRDIEGLIWVHPDGRMVKLKGCDFGRINGRLQKKSAK